MPSPEDINYQQPFAGYDDPTLPQRPYQEFANSTQYQPYNDATQYQQAYPGYTDPTSYQQQAGVPVPPPYPNVYKQTPLKKQPPNQASPRMSKAEALTFVQKSKKWLIAGSLVTFGVFSGLAAAHPVGTAASNQNAPLPSNSGSDQQASPSNNQQDPNGNFFQNPQQQQGGGYGFGNGNSNQPPVSG
ncbi:MAG TPA: hypothetical protein VFN23_17380, partial [Ktedonobacteraceae bacterium]|nr:hypothetical protein [Ktedonobacteraceae bacterium]